MPVEKQRPRPFSASIVGGSVGGLAAALELRRIAGADVRVYERSAGVMEARGAGVVMQPEVESLLQTVGSSAEEVSVRLEERVTFGPDGAERTQRAPQLMTAWDTLYKTLKEALQGSCYRQDSRLVDLREESEQIRAVFADGYEVKADILVGADGVNSSCRRILVEDSPARYSGYVAWRGLEHETDLSPGLLARLDRRFTFFQMPGSQFLCYLVPGEDGATEEGGRRVNWVWYMNADERSLPEMMQGSSGRSFVSFLPKGEVRPEIEERVQRIASRSLPDIFCRLLSQSTLFMQPVQDADPVARHHGRTVLIGDAAGTVRPHTAAGTSKAFGDATALGHSLRGWSRTDPFPESVVSSWDEQRQSNLLATAVRGFRLARGSGLGVPGAPESWELG
ncbi:MAG: FAD-dependent monooxygenase [Acidobacteriota bacterium]